MTNLEIILNIAQEILAIVVMISSVVSLYVYIKRKVNAEGKGDKRSKSVSVFLHFAMWILAWLFAIHAIMRFI